MTSQTVKLFLFLASYAPWGSSEHYPRSLFRLFAPDLVPEKIGDKDPPKRDYSGREGDVRFWFAKKEAEWGRWLFFRRKTKDHRFYSSAHWVDRAKEPMKSGGDYHSMFFLINTSAPDRVVDFWRNLCFALHPFHAFLDTFDKYNQRAHEVREDGEIRKLSGWYFERIPGFFACNYFGNVYVNRWGNGVLDGLPASLVARDPNGAFIASPSGLDVRHRLKPAYAADDLAVISKLEMGWFHVANQPDQTDAPSLRDFLEATPKMT